MAVFGQMFLNRGTYGDGRVLSPASVREMTRNQIPGISAQIIDEYFPEAFWGFGWCIEGNKKAPVYSGTLRSPKAFNHGGSGGVFLWVDPVYEIVGAYFSVFLRLRGGALRPEWAGDLYVNAVTAAIVDG
jgi:CubicO group peptidase (beta-lactamase class C family)